MKTATPSLFARTVGVCVALVIPLMTAPVKASDFYWDVDGVAVGNDASTGAGLGGTGVWDSSSLWWDLTSDVAWPNALDTAVFFGTAGTVSLGGTITAGGLQFDTGGFVIDNGGNTSNTLNLVGPAVIGVSNLGDRAVISAQITGTSGLTKTGNGSLQLTNATNSFSGDLVINGGSLIVTDPGQLGTGTTTISVNGLANTGSPGYSGGSLVLQGGAVGAGMTIARGVSVTGRGPGPSNNSGALISIGNNTITGNFVFASTGSTSNALAVVGNTTLAGGVDLGSGANNVFFGNGNWIVSGVVTGYDTANDRLIKTGLLEATTMWLQNNANNYAQTLRIDSGTVRVSDNGALGTSVSARAVDLNGGYLEVQTDAPNFSTRNVYSRGNGNGIIIGRAIGGSGLNQTVTFGNFDADNAAFTLNGRDGYAFRINGSLGAGTNMSWSGGNNMSITNNLNGVATFDMNIQHDSEGTARVFTVTGNGDTVITGAFLANGSSNPSLVKSGVGQLTLSNTTLASTDVNTTTISQGTLAFASANVLPIGQILIGNTTTTSGALSYIGAGDTLSRDILLNTTTANAYIYSNGTGALTVNGTMTALAGNKTLVLGGSNTGDNTLASAIPSAAATLNLQKIGSGTWVLAPTVSNAFTGSTTISGGILKLSAGAGIDVIPDAGAVIFNVDTFTQAAGGTLNFSVSSESAGALTLTAGQGNIVATSGTLSFASLATRIAGATLNVSGTGTVSVTGTSGFMNAGIYYKGADFAYSDAGTLRAPVYGTDLGFATSAAALTAAAHNEITGGFSSGALAINSLKINGGNTLTLTGALTVGTAAGSGIIQTGGSGVITGGSVATSLAANDLAVRVDGAGNTLTISSPITTSTAGLTKSGNGTLLLSGANTYTGTVNVNEGTLKLAAGGLLGATNINLNVRQDATFDLNGVNVGTVASGTNSMNALNGAGAITNSGAAQASLRVGNNNAGGLYTGLISGNLGFVKAGNGTLVLSGANTFTGPVTLLGGNLDLPNIANIGVASGIGTGDATSNATNAASIIFNGGALRYVGVNGGGVVSATQTPSVSIDRLFTLAGNGTIASYGSYGNTSASRAGNNAALIFNNTADVAFSGSGARTLTLDGDSTGDNEIALHLIDNPNTGALSITKANSGMWILSNANNSYSGTTTISGGVLRAIDGASLPTTSNLFLNGGLFESNGTFNRGLGTGAGQFRFLPNGNSGFSAGNSKLTVDWSSLGAPVWGTTTNFIGAGTLLLNSTNSLADVEIKGDFSLGAPAAAASLTITTANANSAITVTTGNTTGLQVGQAITGTNIPAGSWITSINSATSFNISQNATAAGTGITASIAAGGWREINVLDNGNTGMDFATVSGVISGTAGLGKVGTANLILGDSNTYSGPTVIRQEAVFATSIGAAGATSSSFGTNVGGGILQLGNPGNSTTVNLMYVGPGEVTTREIDIAGTTGTRRIDSSGSGALVLTNVVNTSANSVVTTGGARTLEIRGNNTDSNMITSVLADFGGALSVGKYDGGVWILNPTAANTFTGSLTAGGGTLGLTANGIGSASQLNFNNGAIFAYGGDLVTSTLVQLNNNTAATFAGSNNITFNGNVQKQAGGNEQTFSNNLEGGAILTVNGNLVDLETATNRIINVRGFGSTVWNGAIQNSSGAGTLRLDVRIANDASFTLGGANTLTGGILLGQGTLVVNNLQGLGTSANNVILDGGVLTSLIDLTGANKVLNKIQLQGDPVTIAGAQSIELGGTVELNASRSLLNSLDSGKTLTLSGNITNSAGSTLNIFGSGNTVISGTYAAGTGTNGLTYSGTGALSLTAANGATGALTVNRNTVTLSGAGTWAAGTVTLNPTGTLTLDNSAGTVNRLGDALGFTAQGGTLNFIGASAGSSETTGALNLSLAQSYITMNAPSSGSNTLTFASVAFTNTGSSLNLTGVQSLGTSDFVKFTAAPALTNSILPRMFVGGDFATYDATAGVKAFTGYNATSTSNITLAAAIDTVEANAAMTNIGFNAATQTINALKIKGTGLDVTGASGTTLNLTAGSILNTGGDNTLSMPIVASGGLTAIVQVDSGTTLHMESALTGTNGLLKALDGTLVLDQTSYITSTTNLLGGTLKLNAGLNTLFPNQLLNLNPGATLDLNGNAQYTNALIDAGAVPGAGGTITSSTGTGTFVTNMSGGNYTVGSQITGAVNFGRIGGNTLTVESAQTYTGSTVIMGGTTSFQDDGTLLSSSRIDVNGATLQFTSNASLQTQNNNRIGDTIPIFLRGGTLNINGRVDTAATETIGALTLAQGANTLQAATGGTGTAGAFTSMDLTVASLTRQAGTTINFLNSTALGGIGNFPRIYFTAPPTVYGDGVLGPWAISNSSDYAAYNTTNGVGTVGNGGYAGYSATFGSGLVTDVGTMATAPFTTTLNGTTTTSMLRVSGNFTDNIAFGSSTDKLVLEQGGLLRSNNAFDTSIGTTAVRGVLTSGTSELVIYNAATGNPGFGGSNITTGSKVITMGSTVGIQPGMTLTGTGIPAGTTVLSVDSLTQITLSQDATATNTNQTVSGGSFVSGVTTSGSPTITMNSTVGLAPGMTLTGTGIPTGTYIVSVDSPTQVTLSQNATAAGTNISFAAGVSNLIINSVIADGASPVTLVKSGAGVMNLSANNTYTGGTIVDQGTLNLIGTGAVIPAGGLTINNATVNMMTNAGQIEASNDVKLVGSASLTLAGGLGLDNTLGSIAFENNGGSGNPTVTIPTGSILNLTDSTPVSATSANAATTPTITGGSLSLGTGAKTIDVGAIQLPDSTNTGVTYTEITPALNIVSAIVGAGTSINKTGDGILQLSSATSTFDGGVNLVAGGLMIGSSTSVTTSADPSTQPYFASGPLGTGTLTIGDGTSILADSSGRAVVNPVVVAGDFKFDGTASLALNGVTDLGGASRDITVVNPGVTATMGGVITNGSIVKDGLGTLLLNNANGISSVTLNDGTLIAQLPIGAVVASGATNTSPLGGGAVNYNGGILSLRSSGNDAVFGNDLIVNSALSYVNLDVQGGNTITMGALNLPMSTITGAGTAGVTGGPTVTQVNVTGTTGSTLKFVGTTLNDNGDGGTALTRTAGQYETFNISSGVTTILMDNFCRNNEPLNIGTGTLLLGGMNCFTNSTTITTSGLGAAPTANASTSIYGSGQSVTLTGGTVSTPLVYTILPQMGSSLIAGNSTGGLQQQFFNNPSAPATMATAGAWGFGATGMINNDTPDSVSMGDRPLTAAGNLNSTQVFNGYINITTGGAYQFMAGSDDQASIVIDGVEVGHDFLGHGVYDTVYGSIGLTAGVHAITIKYFNAGGGAGNHFLYSGPDTAAGGTLGGWQGLPATALSYFTGPANAGNNYWNAALIDNDYVVSASSVVTLAGSGSDFNSAIKSLTVGNSGQVNATNDLGTLGAGGTGFLGVLGTTTVGTGVTLNPTSGNLYLIGGISDSGNGVTKAGNGVLMLNNSGTFTGALTVNAGTVRVMESNALTSGTTTINAGAVLDTSGTTGITGTIVIKGTGATNQGAALYNSMQGTGSLAASSSITLGAAGNNNIGGYGDIVINGSFSGVSGNNLVKVGPDTLTLAGNNSGFAGTITVSAGVLNNGALNTAPTGGLGSGAVTVNTGTVLNLNGNNFSQALTIGGTGLNLGPNGSSQGALINSSISEAVTSKNSVVSGSNMEQLANTANTATISSNITLSADTYVGSNTFATGGDIIASGIISGAKALYKVGGDTLTLRGVNTYSGGTVIDYGTLKLDSGGVLSTGLGNITVHTGASLVLDNSGTAVQNRLNNGTASPVSTAYKTLTLNGGTFTINGNASTAVTESVYGISGNTGGIVINNGANIINLVNNGANVTLSATRSGTAGPIANANAATVLIKGTNLGSAPAAGTTNLLVNATGGYVGQNGNGGGNTVGIIPWAIVDNGGTGTGTATGVSFATETQTATGGNAVNANGVRALQAAEYATALTGNANVNMTGNLSVTAESNVSINSLTFATANTTLSLLQGTTLNIQSGGILVTTAGNVISGPGIIATDGNSVAQNLYVYVTSSGSLELNATLGSTQANTGRMGELVKSGAGTLTLGGSNFYVTHTRVQEGTLKINNASAIFYRPTTPPSSYSTTGSNSGQTLQVNAGGTVDMNGFDLIVNNLNSINPTTVSTGNLDPLSGGTITGTGGKTLAINQTGGQQWNGVIAGAVNFSRYGRDTTTVANTNTYTGVTTLAGGRTTLIDLGAFNGTSAVKLNQAALYWDDTGLQSNAWRLGATPASITFNGGMFVYNGRNGEDSVANLGAVSLASGANNFNTTAAAYGSATTQMTSFSRSLGATLSFNGTLLGGGAHVVVSGAAPTNYNGIVGGWAVANMGNPYVINAVAGDFVTYDAVNGFRPISDYKTTAGVAYGAGAGIGSQPAYGVGAFAANENVKENTSGTLTLNAGNAQINSLSIGTSSTTTLAFTNSTDTLFLQSGGLIGTNDNAGKVIGSTVGNGRLTAGNSDGSAGLGNAGYELFLHNLGNTLTVNSVIADNGSNAVTLVLDSGNVNGPAIRLNASNTYTGSTIINGGDIRLNSTGAPALANSTTIIINGGSDSGDTARQNSNRILLEQSNQMNAASNVTLNSGTANLDLNNFNQTVASLTFKNIGGHTANSNGMGPNVRTGTGALTLTGGVTASDISNTSTIAAINGNLILTAGQHTFDVALNSTAPSQVGLGIAALVSGTGGIDKAGDGVLALTGVNTYSGATNVLKGTLVLGGVREDAASDNTLNLQNSRVNVSSGATVDMRGGNAFIGSLAGAGNVTNSVLGIVNNGGSGNPATLTIGADGTSGANFSGTFTNFINGNAGVTGFALNVTKIGAGNQIISGNNAAATSSSSLEGDINNVGTLDILDGTITVSGASGTLGFTTINIKQGATLTLDNSTNALDNRLGGYHYTDSANGDTANDISSTRVINMQGGTINFNAGATLMREGPTTLGGALAAASPGVGIGNVTLLSGNSVWNFDGGTTSGVALVLNQLNASAGTLWLNAGTSQTLGRSAAGANSINVYITGGMTGQGSGSISTGAAVAGAAGLVGGNFSGIGIRPDVTATDSTGSGFVTYDRYGYRLLTTTEYGAFPVQPDSPLTTGNALSAVNPAANWAAVTPGAYSVAGTSALAASGAAGPTSIALSVANAANISVGDILGGTGVPGGVRVLSVDYTTGAVTVSPYTTTGAIAANQSFTYSAPANVMVDDTAYLTTNTTVGSLRLADGGGILSQGGNVLCPEGQNFNALGTLNTLTVSSGDVIGNVGNTGLTGGAVSAGGSPLRFTVDSTATLNANSYLISTNVGTALVKSGDGVLDLQKTVFLGSATDQGQLIVNGGTVKLDAGGNTLAALNTASVAAADFITVNVGGTLDLNGNNQVTAGLLSADPLPGGGGTVTSATAANLYLINVNNSTATYSGAITGAINLYSSKASGGNNSNNLFASSLDYTGSTTVAGGTLYLRDNGAITATSGVSINQGNLQLENGPGSIVGSSNRLSDTAPITMNGGVLTLTGRADTTIAETIGAVTFASGNSTISVGSSVTTATTLSLPSITRSTGATANFATNFGTLGGTSIAVQGTNPRIMIAGQATGIIGSWAIANGTNFAYYDPVLGVGEFGNTNSGFPTYESSNYSTATAAQNVNDGATRTVVTNLTFARWRIAPNAANTATIGTASGAGNSVTLTQGGLLTNNNNTFVIDEAASQITRSTLTSSTSELDVFVNGNTTTIGLQIVGAGMSLVKAGGGTLTLTPKASNTYSGTTYVNGGTLNLSAGSGIVVVPGDLNINNATVTMNTNAGQIATTSNVTVVGTGTLNLVGASNTLQSLTFNNIGGSTLNSTPTVTGGTDLVIGSGGIKAVGDNPGSVALISSPTLKFVNAASAVIDVSSNLADKVTADLVISSVIANDATLWNSGALQKNGNGNLVLSGTNTFGSGFSLNAGTVTVANTAAFGSGTLTLGDKTTLTSDGAGVKALTNAVVVAGNVTFGGQQANHGITLTGPVDLGSANRTLTVTSPLVTTTLSGVVSGSGGLTKEGDGILALNGANVYTGGNTLNAGLVTVGNATGLGANTNSLAVNCGATLSLSNVSVGVGALSSDSATDGGLITSTGGSAQTLTIGNGGASGTFGGVITNGPSALNIVKTGAGTEVLNGTNTYTGTTTINGGVLQVGDATTGTAATLGSGAVTVNSGGTLAGTGHVLAPSAGNTLTVASGGFLAPGATGGTDNGNLTLGSLPGSGLSPLAVNTAVASPSTISGVVNLAMNGQLQLGITTPTYNSTTLAAELNAGTFVDAATTFASLNIDEAQTWNAQAMTLQSSALVGSSTLTFTGNAASIGLGNVAGNGGLYVGQLVTGAGIAAGTTITSITTGADPVITLSSAITAASNAITVGGTQQNVTLVAGMNSIVLADTTGITVGAAVSGYGIPANAVVASISGNVITLKDATSGVSVAPLDSTPAPTLTFAAPGSYDHVSISGNLSLVASGTAVSVLDNGYLSAAKAGDIFNLLDWATLDSGWTVANAGTNLRTGGLGGGNLELPNLSPGLAWDVSMFSTNGIIVVVPEPGRVMLLLFGLAALVVRRRRRSVIA